VLALDALIDLDPANPQRDSRYRHLAIHPYPAELEKIVVLGSRRCPREQPGGRGAGSTGGGRCPAAPQDPAAARSSPTMLRSRWRSSTACRRNRGSGASSPDQVVDPRDDRALHPGRLRPGHGTGRAALRGRRR
jgi:hypothetical protein